MLSTSLISSSWLSFSFDYLALEVIYNVLKNPKLGLPFWSFAGELPSYFFSGVWSTKLSSVPGERALGRAIPCNLLLGFILVDMFFDSFGTPDNGCKAEADALLSILDGFLPRSWPPDVCAFEFLLYYELALVLSMVDWNRFSWSAPIADWPFCLYCLCLSSFSCIFFFSSFSLLL